MKTLLIGLARFLVFASLLLAVGTFRAAELPSATDFEFFEKRVRPVLVQHCLECHGEKRKGNLRLDSRAAAIAGGDLGPAVVPGKVKESLLLEAISYKDEFFQMPPTKKLSDTQIADLTEWVRRGAPWPGDEAAAPVKRDGEMVFSERQTSHWAWQPLLQPPVPESPPGTNPIDAFLNDALRQAGISPAPPADPRVFLRRLTFDLTGLPPTPEEVEAFARAAAPDPQEVIERLLASPHYGERYARHWLDVARYADSNGSEVDHAMANAWRYRDWVVRALNADMPFDQFAREQIAGDLIPGAGPEALAATGFLLLGPKALAELDKPKLLADVVDEQVDTVSRAFLALTVGCARCHDHKFDPIGDEDNYALAGIFASTRSIDSTKRVATWHERPLGDRGDEARVESLMQRIAALQKQRDAASAANVRPPHRLAAGEAFVVIEAEDFSRGNIRAESDNLGRGIGVVRTLMQYPDHIEYDIEVPEAGEYQLELRYAALESRPTELHLNGNLEEMAAAAEATGNWRPEGQRWFTQGRYPFRAGKNVLAFHRDGPVPLFDKILIGRPSDTPHAPHIGKATASNKSPAANPQNTKRQLDATIAAAQRELEEIPTVMAPLDGPVADAPLLVRGNPANPGPRVPRGFPRILASVQADRPGTSQSGRLELAHWLTRPDNPLTARVIVNRVWQWHFGEGLVRSPDNFGLRGETPSHPELLDWLAIWFVKNGWSLKKLHTLICTSEAYARSGLPDRDLKLRGPVPGDPDNRLLGHFPRRRLSAEELRDAMLVASGQLDRTVGGSLMTVLNRTYANGGTAPADIVRQMHYDAPRRSLYLPIIRTALNDFLAAFDYPDPGMLTGRRAQTTVAPQALFLMNSPFVKEQAAALAARVRSLPGDDAARIVAAYEIVVSRPPSDAEAAAAAEFLARDAKELAADGAANTQDAAWNRLCHALLASNEFLYVQ
jgi:cytochrome c553